MSTKRFDEAFDDGEDVRGALDLSTASRPNLVRRRVNIQLPSWMVDSLDQEAARLGVTRQSVIKMWLAERLDRSEHHQ